MSSITASKVKVHDNHTAFTGPSSRRGEGFPLYCQASKSDVAGCKEKSTASSLNLEEQGGAVVGRFAPTPSGKLHLGNLFSFMVAYLVSRRANGKVLMRIEDLDPARSKQAYIDSIFRCLDALGFEWDNEPLYQSKRTEAYREAYEKLKKQELVYPCFCTRADLHAANAPHYGEEVLYAGTCRALTYEERLKKAQVRNPASRVIVPSKRFKFEDLFQGATSFNLTECSGDFVVRRSDGVYAYQLAVVVDDASMDVTSVVRGFDLLTSTPRQIFLQECLGYPTPHYGHVPLILDTSGKRLAKRDKDTDIETLLFEKNVSPQRLLGELAYATGLSSERRSMTLDELTRQANLTALKGKRSIKLSVDL